MRKAKGYIQEGNRRVIDIDLEKFFDKVNHARLMGTLAKRIEDKRLLRLIRKYLKSGIMINGIVTTSEEGTPQGGPLSPLLSNIVLDELDKELEERGHKFVRHADDCNIYVKTQKAGNRVMSSVTSFIEGKLKLKVNLNKSAVDRPWKRNKIRKITSRKKPYSMDYRIKKLNQYLMGWCGYFALADMPSMFIKFDSWIKRRLRMCMWKNWKKPGGKVRRLIGFGVPKGKAYEWGNSRKGYWRISKSPISRYEALRHRSELNRRILNGTYGGVRGRELIAPTYSILLKTRTLISEALSIQNIF